MFLECISQIFSCRASPSLHCSGYFGPFFHSNLLKSCEVLGLLLDSADFQIFHRSSLGKISFQNLEMLFTPSLLANLFGIVDILEDPVTIYLQKFHRWKKVFIQHIIILHSSSSP